MLTSLLDPQLDDLFSDEVPFCDPEDIRRSVFALLDKSGQNSSLVVKQEVIQEIIKEKPTSEWTRKQKRLFHRINSGIERHPDEILRFLSLSSVDNPKKGIRSAWGDLVGRIRRLTVRRLIKQGVITEDEATYFYRGVSWDSPS